MKDEGHRLIVDETLARQRQARAAERQGKVIDDEAIMFGEEAGTMTRRETSEADRQASVAAEGTDHLGHIVARSVRALNNDLEPSHFHRASEHLSQRGTGLQVAHRRPPRQKR
mmetsp:Transcript_981/g.2028  ORF Transcript_981/g.2028 Transcript_981/m.2028 type:complete len:113 (-) Transcript_981:183-521(-)